ncbi:MAG TPA: hypothetical protein VE011_04300 [Candidatus Dormibacteraeota bacterium]|nr:hypothetical protein [Candidatus Dormibacteraeota bacterium]
MQQSIGGRPSTAGAVIGVLLIAVGAIALVLREIAGSSVFEAMGSGWWPFLVIVPGVVLLGASLVPAPPRGIGFAIAGAVVTTVGGLLLYQSQTAHWESWAYAWALLPLAAGLALVVYGRLAHAAGLVRSGLWLGAAAASLFAAGLWFFEGVFAGEPRPTDLGSWWPAVLIVIGALVMARAILAPPRPTAHRPAGPGGPPA